MNGAQGRDPDPDPDRDRDRDRTWFLTRFRRGRARTPRSLVGGGPADRHTLAFDGRELPAQPGQSIAAVLWNAGILAWRTTREGGAPRGAFCGTGSCHDCLVTVNGRPNQRACLVPAGPGDTVTTQEGTGRAELGV
ncbi:(2Fe-2S)-binding protein [Streptomyces sp. NPDC051567]|uniref:(2Fe-2S)-binding protein n=1 Tax=Streptomyces sp. NPDC051567 TaxID=3365660 RepID=UPI0037B8D907